jgi:hypothetical protein
MQDKKNQPSKPVAKTPSPAPEKKPVSATKPVESKVKPTPKSKG